MFILNVNFNGDEMEANRWWLYICQNVMDNVQKGTPLEGDTTRSTDISVDLIDRSSMELGKIFFHDF